MSACASVAVEHGASMRKLDYSILQRTIRVPQVSMNCSPMAARRRLLDVFVKIIILCRYII